MEWTILVPGGSRIIPNYRPNLPHSPTSPAGPATAVAPFSLADRSTVRPPMASATQKDMLLDRNGIDDEWMRRAERNKKAATLLCI